MLYIQGYILSPLIYIDHIVYICEILQMIYLLMIYKRSFYLSQT